MKQYRQHWCWKFALGSWLVMGSVIGEAVLQTFALSFNCAFAQITPDSTLPNNSSVTTQNNISTIEGGTQAGSNLFHSFQEFSVPTNSGAYFNNAVNIQNIISRVTGGSVSNIDGLIGTNGKANLFLINPNGIIFGANASLNVGGSFVASTANALQFGNRGFFSATEKNIPSPLLTINPSALLFNQINQNAAIQNNSVAPAGIDPAGLNALGLRVPDGKSLLLVGGNVSMDGGRLNAFGGRVELGGLGEPDTVALGVDGDNLSLIFPDNVGRASVSLTNQAGIYVTGAGGGNIAVNARNVDILGASILSGGIGQGLGTSETIGGDITLNATGEIKVADESLVLNDVRLGSLGNGGNITIDSGSLSLGDRAQLSASTFGQGNAGNVTLRVQDAVTLADNAEISSTVSAGGVGKGGNIDINAASLWLKDGAQLRTSTEQESGTAPAGRGDAGNVNVNVTGIVNIAGEKNGFASGIRSGVETGTVGNAGNITIDSGSFSLSDDARLTASTNGQGNAGNVTLRVRDAVDIADADIYSRVWGVGQGGNIDISAATLWLKDGAELDTSTFGQGNAGNVTVRVRDAVDLADSNIFSTVSEGGVGKGGNIDISAASLWLKDGSRLVTSTKEESGTAPAGRGDAGNVNVNVTGIVNIAGEKNGFASGIRSEVETGTVGNAGNITIDSGSFSLSDEARLTASTSGVGNAGNVTLRVRDAVDIADSEIYSTVSGVGNGGNIDINAGSLSLRDNAEVSAPTFGQGNAGNVTLRAQDAVDIADSAISISVGEGGVGKGGNIDINAGSLWLDEAYLSTLTSGVGNAGNVTVRVQDAVTLADSDIESTVSAGGVGKGGNIDISAASLWLKDGSQLVTSTEDATETAPAGRGDAGNVNVNVTGIVNIAGKKNDRFSWIRSEVETGTVGNGGNITIDSGSLSLSDEARLIASTNGQGNAGNVTVRVRDAVEIADSAIESTVGEGGVGKGGNIDISAASLRLKDGAYLSTSTSGQGNAGNVTVRAQDAVILADNAEIYSTVGSGGVGKGGNIDISAASLWLKDGSQLVTSTKEESGTAPTGRGDAGNVNVNVTGVVNIAGEKNGFASGIRSEAETGTVGNAGNITIDSGSFSLSDEARLNASNSGVGNAGNVTLRVRDAVDIADSEIYSTAGGVGNGGNIDINAATLSLRDEAEVSAPTFGQGNAGNVTLRVRDAVNIADSAISISVGEGGVGKGGNIDISAASLWLKDGAYLTTSTSGVGNAGNVTVRVQDAVDIADSAVISSTVSEGGVGKGGNIYISAASLWLKDGARLVTSTEEASPTAPAGQGDAGNVNVNVTGIVNIAGEKNGVLSGIRSRVETGTVGNAGNITIDSGSFSLSNDAEVSASTFGEGNAGNVTVRVRDALDLADSAILSTVESGGLGKGGNIDISAASLRLKDGAYLTTSTSGQGNAGNVTVRVQDAVDISDSAVISSTVKEGGVGKGGNIDIFAASLWLKDGARLVTSTEEASPTAPAGRGDAGNVNVNVTGIVNIAGEKNGFASGIRSEAETGAVGNAGNITIDSGSFSLSDEARLNVSTSGVGNAGNVTLRVRDAVDIADSEIYSTVSGVGNGGNIDINAGSLSLRDNAEVSAPTFGQGNAGNVTLRVQNAVEIADSAISISVNERGVGKGGNIDINAGSLWLDEAYLSTSTSGVGNAGNVTVRVQDAVTLADSDISSTVSEGGVGKGGNIDIFAASLWLKDGSQVVTSTEDATETAPAGRGDAGNVNVNVTGIVNIAGKENGVSGIRSRVETGTVGNGGNITIDSGSFSLSDRAQLVASTEGQGNAGTIKVNAADFFTISGNSSNNNSGLFVDSQSPTGTAGDIIVTSPRITLDNSGTLNAQSTSGNGGNINLQTDLLLMRRGASISTTAGTDKTGGNGGNITINAPSGFIVAVPNENSDITANAYTGSGGRVDIRAFGIYGIQPRSNPTSLSDITASSEFGVNGTVELNTPDIDPNSGLVNLPTVPVDTQVAQTCQAGGNLAKSSFTITGRGGLPPNPGEALNADAVQVDLVALNPEVGNTPALSTNPINPTPDRIVEATGWVIAANGDVILTNSAPTVTPHSSWQRTADCRVVNQRQGG
ncbi:filamentous hemagglutinin N-terminal domain-containing protein [Nostoc flagelliforme]|uniref:two-partner secretion domain-containing protein n=1 Tax=Nostoc flagelliforme TaxID=1306274 RepID=UPI0012FE4751|nr:filamentous hemagglutinin N-terminal domain-containing protein [Nostoc flagelliforme]